jgi:poly [ADP-ribose] polymerase
VANFPARRVDSTATDGFNETLEHLVLHCGNVIGNNNKFYCIEIQKSSQGTYRLFTHYGRLNKTNVYEVRDNIDGQPITDLKKAKKEYERIIAKKKKGKKQDSGGIEKYVPVDVIIPTVGSDNIRRQTVRPPITPKRETKPEVAYSSLIPDCQRIVQQFLDENVHAITTSTAGALKFTSRGLETPLGPVTLSHIDSARFELHKIKNLISPQTHTADRNNRVIIDANNNYYSKIPHDLGSKIKESDWIVTDQKLLDEYELLDQLAAAVQAGITADGATTPVQDFHLEPLTDPELVTQIINAVRNSKAENHRYLDVWKWDVKNIYTLEVKKDRAAFEKDGAKLSNQISLFHGSKNQNCLSILLNGLIIPPYSPGHCSGRAFGDGLYFASSSTKSLNYSTGFWNGRTNRYKNAFLFVVKVAIGNTYQTYTQIKRLPAGYDSCHALASPNPGPGRLYNDEYIVYRTSQTTIQYIVEMVGFG